MSSIPLEALGTLLGALAAIVAVGITVWQYFQAKRLRQFQLASGLVSEFSKDELLKFAVTCVDWGGGLIPVPPAWQPIIGQATIKHDISLFRDSLRVELQQKIAEHPQGMLYRHAFVALFNHFETINMHLDRHAIWKKDLGSISWLAKELWNWRYAKGSGHDPSKFFMEAAVSWYDNRAPAKLIKIIKDAD